MGMGSAMTRTPETPQQEPTSLPSGVTGIRSPYPTFTSHYSKKNASKFIVQNVCSLKKIYYAFKRKYKNEY